MARIYTKMTSGQTGIIKAWAATAPAPVVFAHGISERYTTLALAEDGVSLLAAIIASAPAASAYSLPYALGQQYAPSYYGAKSYGGVVELRALDKPLDKATLAALKAMPEKTRLPETLLAALAEGKASVPYVTLTPALGAPHGKGARKDSKPLVAVMAAQVRAVDGDVSALTYDIIAYADMMGIELTDIGLKPKPKAKPKAKAASKAKPKAASKAASKGK